MTSPSHTWPYQRLGKWSDSGWEDVSPLSVKAPRVHVFCHGWAPGLQAQVEGYDGFLRVWDDEAESETGARYDQWMAPLATAITELDPEAVVLSYSWIDESATSTRSLDAIKSQIRTTVNGQRLAVALDRVITNEHTKLHLIGHSHGAKVVSVAATLLDRPPAHVTILDSPENMLPILGGALNNLGSYLRMLPIGVGEGSTMVDNYPSKYGIRYGERAGLGGVVDCMLDPEQFPIEGQANQHSYAWSWYLHTAQHPELRQGLMWSPLIAGNDAPPHSQLQQRAPTPGADPNPWELEYAPYVRTGGMARQLETRLEGGRKEPTLLSTDGRTKRSGVFFRRAGDQLAVLPMRWREGDDLSTVRLVVNRTERWRGVKGWSDTDELRARVPLGGMRSGPAIYEVSLESQVPAAIEIGDATVRSMRLPSGAEYRAWLRPFAFAVLGIVTLAAFRTAWKLLRSKR